MGNWQENGAEALLCQGAILLNTGLNLWKKLMNTIFYIYSQIKHTTIMIWTNHPCISPWRQPSNWAYSYLSTFSILVVCSLLDCVHVQSDSTGRHVNSFSLHLSTLGLSLSQDNNKQIPITIYPFGARQGWWLLVPVKVHYNQCIFCDGTRRSGVLPPLKM